MTCKCRVGITTDPDERKQYWENKHPTLRNWRILRWYSTKSAAQDKENKYAIEHGCEASPGGGGVENAQWAVYRFDY